MSVPLREYVRRAYQVLLEPWVQGVLYVDYGPVFEREWTYLVEEIRTGGETFGREVEVLDPENSTLVMLPGGLRVSRIVMKRVRSRLVGTPTHEIHIKTEA